MRWPCVKGPSACGCASTTTGGLRVKRGVGWIVSSEGCVKGCAKGCAEGCVEGCIEGCVEGCAEGEPIRLDFDRVVGADTESPRRMGPSTEPLRLP